MTPDLGRYFQEWPLEIIKLLKSLQDVATGVGAGVHVSIDGRELVFSKTEPGADRGFLRLIPSNASVIVGFPQGHRLFDPRKRLKGPARSQQSIVLGAAFEVDIEIRRLIEAAYHLE